MRIDMMTCTRALALPTLLSLAFGCSITLTSDTAGGETDSATTAGTDPATSSAVPTTTATEPECGNGVLEAGEACDDGNDVDTDSCTASCAPASCGDGLVWAGVEACDGGGEVANCDADCSPVECGDAQVNEAAGEECDDGNQADADCCTDACTNGRPGQACWMVDLAPYPEDAGARGIAVDNTGRIIVVGFYTETIDNLQNHYSMMLVLDPGGKEVWRKTYDGEVLDLYGVAVDDQGQIFAAGGQTLKDFHMAVVLMSVTRDGELTWDFVEPNPIPDRAFIDAVALGGDGAIYTAGTEEHLGEGAELVLRRHDPADGTPLWRSSTAAGMFEARGEGVALSGSNIAAVGFARDEGGPENPLVAFYDPMGNEVSVDVENHPYGTWRDVRSLGDAGDLLLAGQRLRDDTGVDAAYRRIDAIGDEKWTQIFDYDGFADLVGDAAIGAAVGPDEAIAIGGFGITDNEYRDAFTRLCTGDGAEVWTSFYNPGFIWSSTDAVAFGPGVLVAGAGNGITVYKQ